MLIISSCRCFHYVHNLEVTLFFGCVTNWLRCHISRLPGLERLQYIGEIWQTYDQIFVGGMPSWSMGPLIRTIVLAFKHYFDSQPDDLSHCYLDFCNDHLPHLYFTTQISEKYRTSMCYSQLIPKKNLFLSITGSGQ